MFSIPSAPQDFLNHPTPVQWLTYAQKNIPLLLIDHAHCERKAALTALQLMSKYPEKKEINALMPPLAREELLHFEKVMALMAHRDITFTPLKPSAYAKTLHATLKTEDYLEHLSNQLLIGALIEARSCERFDALIPYLSDIELIGFYRSLFKAEARHFQNYLHLAHTYAPKNIDARLNELLEVEKQLIVSDDIVFRFHGGIPSHSTG